jgi:hypothetical protein
MVTARKGLRVTLPVDQKEVIFDITKLAEHSAFEGPWQFIDIARYISKILVDAGESLELMLPYRLISEIAES